MTHPPQPEADEKAWAGLTLSPKERRSLTAAVHRLERKYPVARSVLWNWSSQGYCGLREHRGREIS